MLAVKFLAPAGMRCMLRGGANPLVFGLGVGENAGKAVRFQCKGNDSELEVRPEDRKQQLTSCKE